MIRLIVILATAASLSAEATEVPEHLLGVEWYGVYFSGQKAGYARESFTRQDDGGYVVEQDAKFQLSMAGIRQDMHIDTKRTYAPDGALKQVESIIETPSETSRFVGVVQGEQLRLSRFLGGEEQVVELPRPTETLADAIKHAKWVLADPVVGDGMEFSLFEPMYQQELKGMSYVREIETRVLNGVSTQVYRIQSTIDVMNLQTESWVTEDGTILEDVVAGNMVMRLEPEEVAKAVDYSNDVIISNAALLDEPLDNPRNRETLLLKLTAPIGADHLFNDHRQTLTAGDGYFTFEGTRFDLDSIESVSIPVTDAQFAPYLQASTYVQSDHADVKAKSAEILDGETDALAAVHKLSDWVHDNMRSSFSARLTNTLEVLKHLEGDCTEHSVLLVGLARAAGIPAQSVAGLIYVESGHPGFYFHQWTRVWVGQWIDVDPTFDQVGVDVTHIKLSEGDLLEQTKLLPLIGQIDVEVLEPAATEAG